MIYKLSSKALHVMVVSRYLDSYPVKSPDIRVGTGLYISFIEVFDTDLPLFLQ